MAWCVARFRDSSRWLPVIGVVLASLVLRPFPAAVHAQTSAADKKIKEEKLAAERGLKDRRRKAGEALKGGSLGAAEQEAVRRYYIGDLVQPMESTATDPQQFPNARVEIAKVLAYLSSSDEARRKHDFLRDEVFKASRTIASDEKKSIPARYNALLMIAELNETESQRSGRTIKPAVPYEPARAVLLKAIADGQPQAIQLAGLLGLQRHARLQAAAGRTDDEAMAFSKKLLAMPEPPAGGTADGHQWMQRIAIEILSYSGKGDQVALLEPIVSDVNRPLVVRCAAAEAIGRLDFAGVNNVNGSALAKGLGQAALAACQQELKSLQDLVALNPSGQGDFRPIPSRSDEEGGEEDSSRKVAPEHPDVKVVRRSLLFHLQCINQGLTGLSKATLDDNAKTVVAALKADVESLLKSLEQKPDQIPATLLDELMKPAQQLQTTVNGLG